MLEDSAMMLALPLARPKRVINLGLFAISNEGGEWARPVHQVGGVPMDTLLLFTAFCARVMPRLAATRLGCPGLAIEAFYI